MAQPGQTRYFKPRAPIKGAFPLDHDGVCKENMLRYMICVQESEGVSSACRSLAKEYFHCRMVNGLMDVEEWHKLGFADSAADSTANSTANSAPPPSAISPSPSTS